MQLKRPQIASLDEVRIQRDGDNAVIEHADQTIAQRTSRSAAPSGR